MRVLLSGATGFIGKPLASYLSAAGHEIVFLTRDPSPRPNAIFWIPEEGKATKEEFEGFDAVVHLAGEPLSICRWTKKKREKILSSRVVGTRFLTQILSERNRPPETFISASAVGFYGDRGEEILDESSPVGKGFLPTVCSEWEKATRAIAERGARTIQTRFGVVLGPSGGALSTLQWVYKLGLGGRAGSGQQWMSWIDLSDLLRSIEFLLMHATIAGPVNVVSPNPVRQEEFSKLFAEVLDRPRLMHTPAWALRLFLGRAADELILGSTRVQPAKLIDNRFTFQHLDLRDTLRKATE